MTAYLTRLQGQPRGDKDCASPENSLENLTTSPYLIIDESLSRHKILERIFPRATSCHTLVSPFTPFEKGARPLFIGVSTPSHPEMQFFLSQQTNTRKGRFRCVLKHTLALFPFTFLFDFFQLSFLICSCSPVALLISIYLSTSSRSKGNAQYSSSSHSMLTLFNILPPPACTK